MGLPRNASNTYMDLTALAMDIRIVAADAALMTDNLEVLGRLQIIADKARRQESILVERQTAMRTNELRKA